MTGGGRCHGRHVEFEARRTCSDVSNVVRWFMNLETAACVQVIMASWERCGRYIADLRRVWRRLVASSQVSSLCYLNTCVLQHPGCEVLKTSRVVHVRTVIMDKSIIAVGFN